MDQTTNFNNSLLRLADTKLVLGNICIATVFNGRSLGDFATILAIAGTSLGATRALYRLLETAGEDYSWLERGRDASQIASIDVLDTAPESWADLMTTIYLTEAASLAVTRQLENHSDRIVANQSKMISKESTFHMAYCLGWIKTLFDHESDIVEAVVLERLPSALRWIDQCEPQGKGQFIDSIKELLGLNHLEIPETLEITSQWNPALGRAHVLPSSLWEIVRFKDPELAR